MEFEVQAERARSRASAKVMTSIPDGVPTRTSAPGSGARTTSALLRSSRRKPCPSYTRPMRMRRTITSSTASVGTATSSPTPPSRLPHEQNRHDREHGREPNLSRHDQRRDDVALEQMDDDAPPDHGERLSRAAFAEHERRRKDRRDERAEDRHDGDEAGEQPERQRVRHAQNRESDRGEPAQQKHRGELAENPRAQRLRDIAENAAHEIAVHRRKERDQELAIESRLIREIDAENPHDQRLR